MHLNQETDPNRKGCKIYKNKKEKELLRNIERNFYVVNDIK